LVEVGFVSNPTEEKYLKTKKGQDYLASAIFRAFREYKNKIEKSSVMLAVEDNFEVQNDESNLAISTESKEVTKKGQILEYCVQLKSSTKKIPVTSRVFKNIDGIKERKIDGIYKYTVGSTKDFNTIVKLQQQVRKKIKDCFVVAFYNGKRISLSKAKELQKT